MNEFELRKKKKERRRRRKERRQRGDEEQKEWIEEGEERSEEGVNMKWRRRAGLMSQSQRLKPKRSKSQFHSLNSI